MWFAITSVVFGAAIGLNVFALWLTDRFGQLQNRRGTQRRWLGYFRILKTRGPQSRRAVF